MGKAGEWIKTWFITIRPFSFPCSLFALLVGTAAAAPIGEWRWSILAAETVAVLLIHVAANLSNDYFDFVSGADQASDADEGRPGRTLVQGVVTPQSVRNAILICLAAMAPLAIFLVHVGGWPIFGLGVFGILSGYAYTGPPFRLKRHALGELCMIVTFGPAICFGAAWMQANALSPTVLLLSWCPGILVAAVLASNNLRDYEEDGAAGVRTLAQVLGREPYAWVQIGLLLLPAALVLIGVIGGMAPAWSLLALAALPVAAPPARLAMKQIRRPDADALTARYLTAFDLLLALGLIISQL